MPDDDVLDLAGACALLKVSARTLKRLPVPRLNLPGSGTLPIVRFSRAELLAWARRHSTSIEENALQQLRQESRALQFRRTRKAG